MESVTADEERIDLSAEWSAVLEDPVPVALSKPNEKRWGFFQFPAFSPLPDGRILLCFSMQPDSVAAYGNRTAKYVSTDGGRTWNVFDDTGLIYTAPHMSVSPVLNGEYLCVPASEPLDIKKARVSMPSPAGTCRAYTENLLYDMNTFSPAVQEYFMKLPACRWLPKRKRWVKTAVIYDTRNGLTWKRGEGHRNSGYLPRTWFERPLLRMGDELFYADYRRVFRLKDGSIPPNWASSCMVSNDNGKTFVRRSTIAVDSTGEYMMAEPMLASDVNGNLVCIIRRTARQVVPMMITRSDDRGRTWKELKPLHDRGVFPSIMLLDCGVMALTYGRPGVYISFSLDGTGRTWTDPVPLKHEPLKGQGGKNLLSKTCGYTSILSLGPNEFLVSYSDFEWKGPGNKKHKAILSRKIRLLKK